MIRVVNLMIELSSTVNMHRRRWTSYEPEAPHPVYILKKNQNVNRMGGDPIHIFKMKMWIGSPQSGLQFFFPKI